MLARALISNPPSIKWKWGVALVGRALDVRVDAHPDHPVLKFFGFRVIYHPTPYQGGVWFSFGKPSGVIEHISFKS